MDIQNRTKVKLHSSATPVFLLYLFLITILILSYSRFQKNTVVYFHLFYLLIIGFLLVKLFWMLICNEIMYISKHEIEHRLNIFNYTIKKVLIKKSEIISLKYFEIDEGVRIKFRHIYTNSIWLSRHYSIQIKYKNGSKIIVKSFFKGPYDNTIQQAIKDNDYSFLDSNN